MTPLRRRRDLRWDLEEDARRRVIAMRNSPLTARDVLRAHISNPRLVRRTLRTMLRGAREAVLNDHGLVWHLHAERIRRVVPEAAMGVEWHREDEFVEALFDSPGRVGRALEIGCGGGRVARHVAPRVGELVCADISQVALDEAEWQLRDQANTTFVLTRGYRLAPLADDEFDTVYAHDVFLTFDLNQTLAMLDEVSRVLRPDGKLVASFDTIDEPAVAREHLEAVRRSAQSDRFSATQMRAWTGSQVDALCETAGLHVVERRHGTPGTGTKRAPYIVIARS